MSKDPGFIFFPGDYLRDTQTMSEKAQVAYDRIMCEHMRNICIRQKQLDFFTKRLNEEEKEELMMVLSEKNGTFQIEWVADSINKRRAYSESRRKNREGKNKKINKDTSPSYEEHMEIEIENENVIEYNKGVKLFYQNQFIFAKGDFDQKSRNGYFRFIGTIFNEGEYKNSINRPAVHILKIENQLTYEEYKKLVKESRKRQISLMDMLNDMINNPKYAKDKSTIYLTLLSWVKKHPIKGTNH